MYLQLVTRILIKDDRTIPDVVSTSTCSCPFTFNTLRSVSSQLVTRSTGEKENSDNMLIFQKRPSTHIYEFFAPQIFNKDSMKHSEQQQQQQKLFDEKRVSGRIYTHETSKLHEK